MRGTYGDRNLYLHSCVFRVFQEAGVGGCNLRFLMVNGGSFNMRFPQTATIFDVKQELIDKKPSELMDFLQISAPGSAPPTKTEELRILHLGKFLEDAKTLQGKHVHVPVTFPVRGRRACRA